jgi:hypothetical protein
MRCVYEPATVCWNLKSAPARRCAYHFDHPNGTKFDNGGFNHASRNKALTDEGEISSGEQAGSSEQGKRLGGQG